MPTKEYDPEELDYLGKPKPKPPKPGIDEFDRPPIGGGGSTSPPPVSSPRPAEGVAYNTLGLGRAEGVRGFDPLLVAQDLVERDPSGWVKFKNWARGIITVVKRGLRPRGSLEDCLNLQPNTLYGALQQRSGYSSYISTPLQDVNGSTIISSIDHSFHLATEAPEAKDVDVALGNSKWAQKPYWQSSTTSTNSWRQWGYSSSVTVSAIAVDKTTITFSGGSSVNDFYNGGVLYNSTLGAFVYIQDYVGSTGVATPNEKIPTNWNTTAGGDSYTFYQDFHTNPPAYTSFPNANQPNAIAQGNAILASLGQVAQATAKFIWSGYIDQTFFVGAAKSPRYQGTYVDTAEIENDGGFTLGNASEAATTAGNGLDVNFRWFIGYLYRTMDGQLSALKTPATNYINPSAADKKIQAQIDIAFPRLNKRIRFIEVFLGRAPVEGAPTRIDWAEYWHVETIDLQGSGWTYTESTTVPGFYRKTVSYDATHWNVGSESSNVVDWTGTTEYTRSTLAASYFTIHLGRLFVARAYDFYDGRNLDDELVWSAYSGVLGTPQYNVLPNVSGFSQGSVESGDPTSITGILPYEDDLIIVKDQSCFRLRPVGQDSIDWKLVHIANIGCDAPRTFIKTPRGLCWVKTGQDIYMYGGGYPVSLTQDTIKPTFLSRTNGMSAANKLLLWGWYNAKRDAYEVMLKPSDLKEFWSTFFEIPVSDTNFAWYRNSTAHNINSARLDRSGNVLFVSGTVYKFDTSTTDAGTAIQTYFDTGDQVLDEGNITHLERMRVILDQDSNATRAGTLDIQLLFDGAEYTFDSISSYTNNVTKTLNRIERLLPIGCRGRIFRFKWNTNASPATWTASSATATPLTIYQLEILSRVEEAVGDVLQQV